MAYPFSSCTNSYYQRQCQKTRAGKPVTYRRQTPSKRARYTRKESLQCSLHLSRNVHFIDPLISLVAGVAVEGPMDGGVLQLDHDWPVIPYNVIHTSD